MAEPAKLIDLRSDTVTKPTPAMREAMAWAEVGDDVYGEDPTVNRLQSLAADMLGTETALFATSGTQSNLLGVMSQCERGDEYVVGQRAHTYRFEGGGAAVLGSIQPQPIEFQEDGTLDLDEVARNIKPNDFHFARTRLLCLENTQEGKVLPLDYLAKASALARQHGLSIHLDGARVFNAAVKLREPVHEITRHFNTVSFCLSKGLGAPVGSVLCGPRDVIDKARRWRKVLGGGTRQAGILAAAGIYALTHHVDRLSQDHENAARLAQGLAQVQELNLDPSKVQTNMVFFTLEPSRFKTLQAFLKERGILISGRERVRLVTHLDVSAEDIRVVIETFKDYFSR
ncbi:MAG: low-specificity L-threonine aldolase [Desulfobacterota bacterium]|jgi:threonine aldolase|nr:low-specificity L-threonine aldolase [Thermodesulfobacteriota bacterium]